MAKVAVLLVGAFLLLTVAPALPRAAADCSLPAPGHCGNEDPCPAVRGGVRIECPTQGLGRQDGATLDLGLLRVEGRAWPTLLIEDDQGPNVYPAGSNVTLAFAARWLGNSTHPATVELLYAFDAHNLTWTSAPGVAQPDEVVAFPAYPTYRFTFSDWSGANTTYQWNFRIPATTPRGLLRLPVAFAVTRDGRQTSVQTDIVLHVASREVPVLPPPPFWQDPAVILLVGMAIGLALGYIAFSRRRVMTRWVKPWPS